MRDLRSDKLITDLNADNHAIKKLSSLAFNADGIFRPGADSTTALQLQNASGVSTILNIDSLSGNVGIGTTSPGYKLDVSGGVIRTRQTGSAAEIIVDRTDGKMTALTAGYGGSAFAFDNTGSFNIVPETVANIEAGAILSAPKMTMDSSGNVGIGTTSPGNLLTVQQNSATDPIADSWTTYSTRETKDIIRDVNPHGYYDRLKAIPLKEWRRSIALNDKLNDVLARHSLWAEGEDPDKNKVALGKRKAARAKKLQEKQSKFHARRVSPLAEDVPEEMQARDQYGNIIGLDLGGYVGFLHAALRELGERVEALETKVDRGRSVV